MIDVILNRAFYFRNKRPSACGAPPNHENSFVIKNHQCHSEGVERPKNLRFFATLRMTEGERPLILGDVIIPKRTDIKNVLTPQFLIQEKGEWADFLRLERPEDYEYSSARLYLQDIEGKYVRLSDLRELL